MPATNYTDATRSASIRKSNAVYNTAWIAAAGDSLTQNIMTMGQALGYQIDRVMFEFDTSALPVTAQIVYARLWFYCLGYTYQQNYILTIMNGQPTYPHDPVVVGDYDKSFYAGNGGAVSTFKFRGINPGDFSVPGWAYIVLSTTGLGYINVGGITKLCVKSDKDISGTPPPGPTADQMTMEGPIHAGGHKPYLEIGYITPGTFGTYQVMNGCGFIGGYNNTYATARTEANGDDVEPGEIFVGQADVTPWPGHYHVDRGFVFFDTRALQPGSSIIDSVVQLYGKSYSVNTSYDITVQEAIAGAPNNPLVASDFNYLNYTKSRGTLNTSLFKLEDWNYIFLTNYMAFVPCGITPMVLRSSKDISGTQPGFMATDMVSFYSSDEPDVTKHPQLVLTFAGGRQLLAPPQYSLTWEAGSFGR